MGSMNLSNNYRIVRQCMQRIKKQNMGFATIGMTNDQLDRRERLLEEKKRSDARKAADQWSERTEELRRALNR